MSNKGKLNFGSPIADAQAAPGAGEHSPDGDRYGRREGPPCHPSGCHHAVETLREKRRLAALRRGADGFLPTEIGRELLQTAIGIDKLIARTKDRIAALQSCAAGLVCFAAVSTAKYFAPVILARFRRQHPEI